MSRFDACLLLRRVALTGAGLTLMASAALAQDWRGWNIHPPGYPNTIALEKFADLVAERTDGELELTVYNNGVLGNQPDAIEQVRSGALEFGNFNLGPMGPVIPATNVVSLPFIFSSTEHMFEVMDGPIGDRFAEAMAEEGLVPVGWFDSGSRSFYNTERPIEAPADLEGLKFRVMNNDLYVEMVDALGGNATPMAFAEVYQSLQTGVIEGAENNFPSYESTNHYEVAPYYSLTQHLMIPECICISKAAWDALSPEQQEIVLAAAREAAELQRELWAEGSAESKQTVIDAGATVNEVADKAPFQAAMEPIYAEFIKANPDLESLIRDIQAAAQ